MSISFPSSTEPIDPGMAASSTSIAKNQQLECVICCASTFENDRLRLIVSHCLLIRKNYRTHFCRCL